MKNKYTMIRFALSIIAVLGLSFPLVAQGIDFFSGTWEEALAKAQKEEKVIFVDAYAEWCGPCKRMAATVFPNEEVGSFYNRHFVNMKIDMEKGMGLDFRKQYPVSAFPTLFFIDAKGEIVQQVRGAQQVEGFLELGKRILAESSNSEAYQERYEAGERDPELLYKYVRALNLAGEPSLRIANEYFSGEVDMANELNRRFLLEAVTEADSRLFGLMVEHRSAIEATAGQEAVNMRIQEACAATAKKALEFRNEALLKEAENKMKQHLPARANAFSLENRIAFAESEGDAKAYFKASKKYAKQVIAGQPDELLSLANAMSQHFPKDKKVMNEAEQIAAEGAEQSNKYQSWLTYSNILLSNGKKEAAKEAAERARSLASSEGPMAIRAVEHYIKQIN